MKNDIVADSRHCTRLFTASASLLVGKNVCVYKDGAVFPRPGLAEVPHVQHMGTMDVSWAPTSPPSGMAMVGQPGGGPIKHLSGLGALVGFARAFEPRSSTGAVRGSLPGGVTGVHLDQT